MVYFITADDLDYLIQEYHKRIRAEEMYGGLYDPGAIQEEIIQEHIVKGLLKVMPAVRE